MNSKKELISLNSNRNYSIEELLQTQNFVSPSVNIMELDEQFSIIANLPGLRRENLQVKIEDNNLVIFGRSFRV